MAATSGLRRADNAADLHAVSLSRPTFRTLAGTCQILTCGFSSMLLKSFIAGQSWDTRLHFMISLLPGAIVPRSMVRGCRASLWAVTSCRKARISSDASLVSLHVVTAQCFMTESQWMPSHMLQPSSLAGHTLSLTKPSMCGAICAAVWDLFP